MIIMEPGSPWAGTVRDVTNPVAIGLGFEDLLQRTQDRLDQLRRTKRALRLAVLACNAARGDAIAGPRARLARLLLGAVTDTSRGRLILVTSAREPRGVPELLTLAESLAAEFRGTGATVSLRLVESSHRRSLMSIGS